MWLPILPARLELYNLAKDPSEKANIAEEHPEIVATLKGRAEQLAREAAPPLLLSQMIQTTFGAPPSTAKGDTLGQPAKDEEFMSGIENGDD